MRDREKSTACHSFQGSGVLQGWWQKLRSPRPVSGTRTAPTRPSPPQRPSAEPALAPAGSGQQLLAQLHGRQAAGRSAGWGRRRGPARSLGTRSAPAALRPSPRPPGPGCPAP